MGKGWVGLAIVCGLSGCGDDEPSWIPPEQDAGETRVGEHLTSTVEAGFDVTAVATQSSTASDSNGVTAVSSEDTDRSEVLNLDAESIRELDSGVAASGSTVRDANVWVADTSAPDDSTMGDSGQMVFRFNESAPEGESETEVEIRGYEAGHMVIVTHAEPLFRDVQAFLVTRGVL